MNTTVEAQRSKIEIRTTKPQKKLIEQAAKAEGVNVTAFIFSRVLPEAQRVLGERSFFVLDQSSWTQLGKILDRPANPNAKLKELMQSPSALEQRRSAHGRTRKS